MSSPAFIPLEFPVFWSIFVPWFLYLFLRLDWIPDFDLGKQIDYQIRTLPVDSVSLAPLDLVHDTNPWYLGLLLPLFELRNSWWSSIIPSLSDCKTVISNLDDSVFLQRQSVCVLPEQVSVLGIWISDGQMLYVVQSCAQKINGSGSSQRWLCVV